MLPGFPHGMSRQCQRKRGGGSVERWTVRVVQRWSGGEEYWRGAVGLGPIPC